MVFVKSEIGTHCLIIDVILYSRLHLLCYLQEPSATPAFVKVTQVHTPPVRPPSISSATAAVTVAGPVCSQVVAPGTGSSLRFATHTKKVGLTESLSIF